jgi:hypothetical protein
MSNILDEVDNLIYEVLKELAITAGAIALSALMSVTIYIGVPLLVILTKTILQYLLFSIIAAGVATGTVSIASFTYDRIKCLTDIDDFLLKNFERLELNGYDNIKQIKDKSIKSRDQSISKCNDEIEYNENKAKFYILKAKCAILALKAYMETCLVELYVYYIKLLAAKGIDAKKASSYEYILSFQEEPTFNLVITSIQNRFNTILDTLQQDQKEFNDGVLQKVKQQISNIEIRRISTPPSNIEPQKFPPRFPQRPPFQRR